MVPLARNDAAVVIDQIFTEDDPSQIESQAWSPARRSSLTGSGRDLFTVNEHPENCHVPGFESDEDSWASKADSWASKASPPSSVIELLPPHPTHGSTPPGGHREVDEPKQDVSL